MDQLERALVRRIQTGDQAAFRELVETHKQNVYYLALDLTGNHYDAEDVSQEVFIKAYKGIGTFRSGARLNTWLYRITMNTFIDRKRKKSLNVVKLPATDEDEERNPLDLAGDEVTGNPERELAAGRIDDHIREALESLSEQERVVFVMRHYEDMALKEISAALDIAEGTVKSLLFRSVRKLRQRLSFYRDELGLEDSL
jgi:RNA polymerase sigma-70 factor (ECF subfamily)